MSHNSSLAVSYERRGAERRNLRVPVVLSAGHATMCDISTSGAYFQGDVPLAVGSRITFAFELGDVSNNRMRIRCHGSVVRCDEEIALWGVAATIDEIAFDVYECGQR